MPSKDPGSRGDQVMQEMIQLYGDFKDFLQAFHEEWQDARKITSPEKRRSVKQELARSFEKLRENVEADIHRDSSTRRAWEIICEDNAIDLMSYSEKVCLFAGCQ